MTNFAEETLENIRELSWLIIDEEQFSSKRQNNRPNLI
jgi:hypothetical protein